MHEKTSANTETSLNEWRHRFAGCLLGAAVGDSIGLPREGLTARRAQRFFGGAPLRQRLVLGHGMISDDTEHACMTAQALLASKGNAHSFATSLAWRLRGWLLTVPAGIGLATLKSICKLWAGFPPDRSGVYSAGNGPAMRAPILGVWLAAHHADDEQTAQWVRSSTRLTHADPRAFEGALVITLLVRRLLESTAVPINHHELIDDLLHHVQGDQLRSYLGVIPDHLNRQAALTEYAESIGVKHGVSGYINQTVPVAIYAILRSPDNLRRAIEESILLGGDTDTVGAIVGGVMGAVHGTAAIPEDWISKIFEWPRSVSWMNSLAEELGKSVDHPDQTQPQSFFWPGQLLRNVLFTLVILAHGFRRLAPPY